MNESDMSRYLRGLEETEADDGREPLESDEDVETMPARRVPSKVMGKDLSSDGNWITAAEAGKLCGKAPTWAYAAAERGGIPTKHEGRTTYFQKSGLLARAKIVDEKAAEGKAFIKRLEDKKSGVPVVAPETRRGAHPAVTGIQSVLRLISTGEMLPECGLAAIEGIARASKV
jgi:hypothetical protein